MPSRCRSPCSRCATCSSWCCSSGPSSARAGSAARVRVRRAAALDRSPHDRLLNRRSPCSSPSPSPRAAPRDGGSGARDASVHDAVAAAVRVVRESGLPHRTTSMFTEIEGEWDEVFDVVKRATEAVMPFGSRVSLVLKADIRPGYTGETRRQDRAARACAGDSVRRDLTARSENFESIRQNAAARLT